MILHDHAHCPAYFVLWSDSVTHDAGAKLHPMTTQPSVTRAAQMIQGCSIASDPTWRHRGSIAGINHRPTHYVLTCPSPCVSVRCSKALMGADNSWTKAWNHLESRTARELMNLQTGHPLGRKAHILDSPLGLALCRQGPAKGTGTQAELCPSVHVGWGI